jgi:DNA-binding NtrC family response regulator
MLQPDSQEAFRKVTPRSTKSIEAAWGGRRSLVSDDRERGAIRVGVRPEPSTILVFSHDASLFDLASRAAGDQWTVERCDDVRTCRESLIRPKVRLVVVDDEAIEDQLRGWLLERVRTWTPQVPLIYVAGNHSEASEKRARAYAASYYTSKPVETESLLRVLGSFISRTPQ